MTMNAKALADQLNTLLATEVRSLARHIDEAKPYVSPKSYRASVAVEHMGQTSRQHAQRLTALLESIEESPRPGSFESVVAAYHFMSLESLLPLLIQEKERQIATYQEAVAQDGLYEDVAAELKDLLKENQAMLDQLRALVQPGAAAAAHH